MPHFLNFFTWFASKPSIPSSDEESLPLSSFDPSFCWFSWNFCNFFEPISLISWNNWTGVVSIPLQKCQTLNNKIAKKSEKLNLLILKRLMSL